jgi:hypothetical protein
MTEIAGIGSSLVYCDFIMTHSHRFNLQSYPDLKNSLRYAPYAVIGCFVAISAYLLMRWLWASQKKEIKEQKKTFALFHLLGFMSLLIILSYGVFFDQHVAQAIPNDYRITVFHFNLTLLNIIIGVLGALSVFEMTYQHSVAIGAFKCTKYSIRTSMSIYYFCIVLISIGMLVTAIFDLFYNNISLNILLWATSGFCVLLLISNFFYTIRFFNALANNYRTLRNKNSVEDVTFNNYSKTSELIDGKSCTNISKQKDRILTNSTESDSIRQNKTTISTNFSSIWGVDNHIDSNDDQGIKLYSVCRKVMQSNIMKMFSWSMFSIACGLLTLNHATMNFVAFNLLLIGFILRCSSTAVGSKRLYYNDLNTYWYNKICCVNKLFHNYFVDAHSQNLTSNFNT